MRATSLHANDIRVRHRVRRDVGPRVVAAGDDGRGDQGHAPVLGLQLGRVDLHGPDGRHALAREAAADLGEAEVESQPAYEDPRGELPRVLRDGDEVPEGVVGGRVLVEERLQVRQQRARDLLDLGLVEDRAGLLLVHDGADDGGLAVQEGLADGGCLAWQRKRSVSMFTFNNFCLKGGEISQCEWEGKTYLGSLQGQ